MSLRLLRIAVQRADLRRRMTRAGSWPPADVIAWLDETYKPEGIVIWLRAYENADEIKRARMVEHARIDPMGD